MCPDAISAETQGYWPLGTPCNMLSDSDGWFAIIQKLEIYSYFFNEATYFLSNDSSPYIISVGQT